MAADWDGSEERRLCFGGGFTAKERFGERGRMRTGRAIRRLRGNMNGLEVPKKTRFAAGAVKTAFAAAAVRRL